VGESPDWARDWAQPSAPPPPAPPPAPGWQDAPGWQNAPRGSGWQNAPGWQGQVPRADYKPGVVPLRPLSVGEILDGGFATIRRNPRVVFGCAFALAAVLELVRLGLGAALSNVGGAVTSSLPSGDDNSRLVITSGGVAAVVLSYVASAIFGAILAGVVTQVVGKAVIGQRVEGRAVLRSVGARWWRLVLVSALAGALPFLPVLFLIGGPVGIIAAVPLAIYLWGKLAVVVPAFVLERSGVGAAIARSWRLVRGAFWRTWGLRALAYLIVVIAASVLSIPFGISSFQDINGGSTPSTGSIALSTIGGGIVWMLTEPLLAAAVTLIYIDRRMRAEALDIQLAQAARQAAAPSAP
jgi:MFS family permease